MSQPERSVTLRCDDCGSVFDLSARHARSIRELDLGYLCKRCRAVTKRKTVSRTITEAERNYWIQRFGLAGAVELSLSIWGPVRSSSPPAASEPEYLAASGAQQ